MYQYRDNEHCGSIQRTGGSCGIGQRTGGSCGNSQRTGGSCGIGLKGQQLSAQGNALGRRYAQPSPCKGKRVIAAITLLPLQGVPYTSSTPRALPWADLSTPFQGAHGRNRLITIY